MQCSPASACGSEIVNSDLHSVPLANRHTDSTTNLDRQYLHRNSVTNSQMDGGKPNGKNAGTSGTVMSIEGLLPDAYSTNSFFVRKWILVKWALGLLNADEHDGESGR
jgi:hypothetical protein